MARAGRNGYTFRPWAFSEQNAPSYIASMDSDGFTVGSTLNAVGTTLYWTAFEADDNVLQVGMFTGNNADNRQIFCATGFVPNYVHVGGGSSGTNKGVEWANPPGTDYSGYLAWELYWGSDYIQGTYANGFVVGTAANQSADGEHVWFAFKTEAGNVSIGQYDGNSTDNRDIVLADAFQPLFVQILGRQVSNSYGRRGSFRDPLYVGNLSYSYAYGDYANYIKQFNVNGFRVGTGASGYYDTNITGNRYIYLAIKSKMAGQIYDRVFPTQARGTINYDRVTPVLSRLSKQVSIILPASALYENNFGAAAVLPVQARAEINFDKVLPIASKPYLFSTNYDRNLAVQSRASRNFDFTIPVHAVDIKAWTKDSVGADSWSKEGAGTDDWTKDVPLADSWGKV